MKTFYLIPLSLAFVSTKCFAQDKLQTRFAAAIRDDLLEIKAQQKADSKNLYIVTIECGNNSKEVALARRINHRNDSIARLKLESIIHVYGYPGPKVIGDEANQVMFNIIYNMDLPMAKKYVPILWQALKNGNTTPEDYAALADKVSMQESNGQIYGTIVQTKGGMLYMPPILNPAGVDSLRRLIGLPPLQANPQIK
ncbi:MAG: DUF6624 domain-containing protein [Mucilaginibacter sp.]